MCLNTFKTVIAGMKTIKLRDLNCKELGVFSVLLFITAKMIAETLGEQLTKPGPYFAKSPWQLKSM